MVWFALFGAETAMAQVVPLHIGTSTPIKDEFGVNCVGAMTWSSSYCDRVEIFWATNGIFPPSTDGVPDPRNMPAIGGITTMGSLTGMDMTNPGTFATSLANPRPPAGSKLFVRVFNAPSRKDASFYADSEVITIHTEASYVYDVTLGTMTPLDSADSDGDGLVNSWEKSLGSDSETADSDGDGMKDGDEFRAGTGVTNDQSFLAVAHVRGDGEHYTEGLRDMTKVVDAVVTWESVSGKSYQIEFSCDPLNYGPMFSNVSEVVTAVDTQTTVTIYGGFSYERGTFRIRLVD